MIDRYPHRYNAYAHRQGLKVIQQLNDHAREEEKRVEEKRDHLSSLNRYCAWYPPGS